MNSSTSYHNSARFFKLLEISCFRKFCEFDKILFTEAIKITKQLVFFKKGRFSGLRQLYDTLFPEQILACKTFLCFGCGRFTKEDSSSVHIRRCSLITHRREL